MQKGKVIFAAYENFWESIFLFCSGSYAAACVLAFLQYYKGLSFIWLYAACGVWAVVLGYILYVSFKPRVKLYNGGIKIPGYPFFEWKNLKKIRFVYLTEERKTLLPDQELEIVPVRGLSWPVSWWRRWFLKEEYCKRIIIEFWVLPAVSRHKLLEHLGHFVEPCAYPQLRGDEKMRLFWRRILFMAADVGGIFFLAVLCFFVAGEWLYQNGNIY